MRQESAVALGKAEAERWVMDRNRSGRSTAGAGKGRFGCDSGGSGTNRQTDGAKAEHIQRGGMAAGQPALGSENRKGHGPKFS